MSNKFYQRSPEYVTWCAMLSRCYNPKARGYYRYGGRGIEVCSQWRHDFYQFCQDMGHRPEGTSIDRIDVNGSYSPDNCRWATLKEQGRNRSTNHNVTVDGVTKTISEWAEVTGMKKSTIRKRLVKQGMSPEEAIKPVEFNSITYDGMTKTIQEWADYLGCCYSALVFRIKQGDSIERIIRPVTRGRTFTYNGKTLTIAQWAKETGINRALLSNRLINHGWDIAEALTRPVNGK